MTRSRNLKQEPLAAVLEEELRRLEVRKAELLAQPAGARSTASLDDVNNCIRRCEKCLKVLFVR